MRILIFCLTFIFLSCAKKTYNIQQSSKPGKDQIVEYLGSLENISVANDSNNLTLVYQKNVEPNQSTRYLVIENLTGEVLSKGTFRAGYIKWKNNQLIEILDIPGIIPKEKTQSDYIRIINLTTQNKDPKP